jgi:molybdopterin molybdotransferase
MLQPEDAWRRLERFAHALAPEWLGRREAAGRVLARPLAATVDVPAADVSAMDGFALAGPPPAGRALPVAGRVAAGDPPGRRLPEGSTLRIMTGAPLPEGADRVIPVERSRVTEKDGGEEVELEGPGQTGDHVRRRGEVMRAGDPLLPAGALLTPGALSVLATHGHSRVEVHRAPRVALVVTGDEVVPPDTEPGPGKLRDSHTDFVLAACRSVGIEARLVGRAPDEAEALRELIAEGLEADVLLLTGGVSMGELDLVEGVLQELGCELLFDAVAVQPGKPLTAMVAPAHHAANGSLSGGPTLVFGLPGNPASVMVGFWLFVRPVLRRLLGRHDHYWYGAIAGELTAPLPGAKGRDRFLPAEVAFEAGRLRVTPARPVGSHDLAAFSRGTALVRVPAGSAPREAGAPCEVLPLVDWV